MRKGLRSKSEHDKCRISCTLCLYRFSSPSPDILGITPSGDPIWGGGGDRSSHHQAAPTLMLMGSFVFLHTTEMAQSFCLISVQTEMWKGKSLTFLTTQNGARFTFARFSLENLQKCSPSRTFGNLNVGTYIPVCCTTLRSCLLLMLKNSEKPPQAHSCTVSGNPGVEKTGKSRKPWSFGFLFGKSPKIWKQIFYWRLGNLCGLVGDVRASCSLLLLHPCFINNLQGCACGDIKNLILGTQELGRALQQIPFTTNSFSGN